MYILFLTNNDNSKPLIDWLSQKENVIVTGDPISLDSVYDYHGYIDYIISYNYKHIVPDNVLKLFPNKAINLHPSLLPYNRGAYSNFFSAVDGTPNGVTIHYLSKDLDKGDILIQQEIKFSKQNTLKQSYDKLQEYLQTIFKNSWDDIKSGKIKSKKQHGKGTYHSVKDFNDKIWNLTINQVHDLFDL